jgi:electron-transferring-flavoprotein dehydrogenase
MERADVAVVGGGPAGAAAGHAAAAAGATALVVEKGVPRADREGPGPDSTDAAGILDYWVDIMGIHPDEFPDDVVLHDLDRAEFVGPRESVTLDSTGIDSSYDGFGFCMQRARFDDFLRARAERAGADYRVGVGVRDVRLDDPDAARRHVVELADGGEVTADSVVLADGPQRTVTNRVLDSLLPFDVTDRLGTRRANHIAYQEHRRLPPAVAEEVRGAIRFWWGHLPGHTAYPWVFPNDGDVARVGLTMPVDLDLAAVDRDAYPLLRDDDETVPQGHEYLRRLLEREWGDEYDVETDFPLVEERGKRAGTETYPISSTRPVESPVRAGVAVAGGAMGTTSAFHEGGDHVAVRTGALAGRLAAENRLSDYNRAWRDAIGDEVRRNVALAEMCRDYGPGDWDRVFRTGRELLAHAAADWKLFGLRNAAGAGLDALRLIGGYKRRKFGLRDGRYCQIHEREYRV